MRSGVLLEELLTLKPAAAVAQYVAALPSEYFPTSVHALQPVIEDDPVSEYVPAGQDLQSFPSEVDNGS